jgi:hypothetical protein
VTDIVAHPRLLPSRNAAWAALATLTHLVEVRGESDYIRRIARNVGIFTFMRVSPHFETDKRLIGHQVPSGHPGNLDVDVNLGDLHNFHRNSLLHHIILLRLPFGS